MSRTIPVEERAIAASLAEAARRAGQDIVSLELLRVGNNYIFADRSTATVFRVSVLPRDSQDVTNENGRLVKLAASGAPILPPCVRAPLELSTGHLATVWPLGVQPDSEPAVTLAPLLATLHQVEPVGGLSVWEGFERGHRRVEIARTGGVPSSLVDEVAGRLERLQAEFPEWSTDHVVHGDPHAGNVVKVDNRHLLIDLDDLALGCPEIDLAPMQTSYSRFDGVPGSWESFLGSYGRAIDRELLDWFVQLRQLTMVAWLFTLWDLRSESRAEAMHRVSTLDTAAVWNPL